MEVLRLATSKERFSFSFKMLIIENSLAPSSCYFLAMGRHLAFPREVKVDCHLFLSAEKVLVLSWACSNFSSLPDVS